jgi:hypothetical protein
VIAGRARGEGDRVRALAKHHVGGGVRHPVGLRRELRRVRPLGLGALELDEAVAALGQRRGARGHDGVGVAVDADPDVVAGVGRIVGVADAAQQQAVDAGLLDLDGDGEAALGRGGLVRALLGLAPVEVVRPLGAGVADACGLVDPAAAGTGAEDVLDLDLGLAVDEAVRGTGHADLSHTRGLREQRTGKDAVPERTATEDDRNTIIFGVPMSRLGEFHVGAEASRVTSVGERDRWPVPLGSGGEKPQAYSMTSCGAWPSPSKASATRSPEPEMRKARESRASVPPSAITASIRSAMSADL